MKYFAILTVFINLSLYAQDAKTVVSQSFYKGQCTAVYTADQGKNFDFQKFDQSLATKFGQKIPVGTKSIACSRELKNQLKIQASDCSVFCHP